MNGTALSRLLASFVVEEGRGRPMGNNVGLNDAGFDVFHGRELVHNLQHERFQDGAETTRATATFSTSLGDFLESRFGKL